jgi:hypothetical protein
MKEASCKGPVKSMPFFYDESNIEWPEDGSDPPPPRADQFEYMTAAEYSGGPAAPARFSILPFSDEAEPEPPLPATPAAPPQAERGGFLRRLFGGNSAPETQQRRQVQIQDSMRRQMLLQKKRTQQLFSTMIPALRSLGVRRAYCRYDGGHDEGFSWLDHYETQAEGRIDVGVLVKGLHDMGIHDQLRANFKDHMKGVSAEQKMADIRSFATDWLANDWAWALLGNFGAGEYSMYGAFTVDLEECLITEDSNAQPIVQNITIAD